MSDIPGYSSFSFAADGRTKTVFTRGSGPAVLILHELPGMVTQCVRLADFVASHGFAVFLPLLFGSPNVAFSKVRTAGYAAQICIRREILLFASDADSPVTKWLRALAQEVRRRCPAGTGIGVIGMCLTGGFTVNLLLEDVVMAAVASQPGLPLGKFGAPQDALGVSQETLTMATERATAQQVPIRCFRFSGDSLSPRKRFERLEREFGRPLFDGDQLPGNGHSVLTVDFVDNPAHPTYQARERVVDFFRSRLR